MTWWFCRVSRGAALVLICAVLGSGAADAQDGRTADKLKAVATFSILGDLVRQIGGERVAVTSLVGSDADAHGYNPSPGDARALAKADIVIVNGLGFEGWIERLIKASGTKARIVVASTGVRPIEHDHVHDHAHDHPHDDHSDPHAWQSVPNAKLYANAIRDGLSAVDPAHASSYAANAAAYAEQLDALNAEVGATIGAIPAERRRVITSHASFGYFTKEYGLAFVAPQGLSASAEAGPADVARIVRQIRAERIPAVFIENIADPRLIRQIARESGARVGARIYSDALSGPDGPAPTYLEMMRANLKAFREALI